MMQFKAILIVMVTMVVMGCISKEDKLLKAGKIIYEENCKVCHAQGINGAPVFGNKKNWATRAPQGIDVLVDHATNGYGLMPAKGGKTHLQESDIHAAITYMLSALD